MELRPRKGRSVQPPSTPTIAKPSPRPPPQSSSRKKSAPVPPNPIHIPSDDEDEDPKEICADQVDGGLQEIYADEVAAASTENCDECTLKQGNQDIILSDSVEFETPLSSIVRLRRAQIKVASFNVKSKTKVTSSNKKMAKALNSTPVADTCIAHDRIAATLDKVELDEAMTKKVFWAPSEDVGSEEIEKQEALTGSVPRKSGELTVEITLLAQETCTKKTEVLSPSIDSKQVYSSIIKSAKKRDEEIEVVDAKLDQDGHPKHNADVDAPIVIEPQALSLILSDDETVQMSDAVGVDGCKENISASKEEALEKCLLSAEVCKASREHKKSQSHKKGIMEGECLSRKLFEETTDITIPCMDTKPNDQRRHEPCSIANSSKEGRRQIDRVEGENDAETVISTSERHSFRSPSASSPSASLKGREAGDFETLNIDGDKLDASDTGIKGNDIVIDCVQDVSEESSDKAASSREERDEDINSDHAKLDAATACSQKNAVHDEECTSRDDDDGNASSGSDDDDDEDEMESIFFSSMKANLQRISEPSGLSMQKDGQAKQTFVSQSIKSVVKKPCTNGGLTGYGLSWSPDIALSALKTSKAQVGKPQSVREASPGTIWGKDQCLQDGLCVPPVDPLKLNKLARKQKDDTAGAKWFNLSAPTITPEIKKELQLVKLRGALDPKRHYKADDSKGLPKYFQVGTVVGGPADFYSGRLTKKEQKNSLASELLSDSSLTAYRKRKYLEIQEQKQAGGKGFWKKKKSKQTPAWAKI